MRNIKKKIKVRTVECIIYNRATKEESTQSFDLPETLENPMLPDGCVLLEQRTVSECERVYTMTPEAFIANATPDAAAAKSE